MAMKMINETSSFILQAEKELAWDTGGGDFVTRLCGGEGIFFFKVK